MHIEFLVEDSSGAKLIEALVPKIIGFDDPPHTWKCHKYKGSGRIPKNKTSVNDVQKEMLLDDLPRRLKAYGKTDYIGAVVVVVDTDRRNCSEFLAELQAVASKCDPKPKTLFCLATEEIEAWYLGDRQAIITAYPKAKKKTLDGYVQDSVCGTWELLANALYPKGVDAVKHPGQLKHEWADSIPKHMKIEDNVSPSFNNFVNGLRQLTSSTVV